MRFFTDTLKGLTPYVPGEQPKSAGGIIKLNTNENPYPPSPRVIEALDGKAAASMRLYPDPDCAELKAALAAMHGVSPENISPGNGSDEVLAFCFHGFCPNGAVFPDITYGFYRVFAGMFGIRFTELRLDERLGVDIGGYLSPDNLNKTVFLANPNAPTGICQPVSGIERLVSGNRDRLVVVDEAYIDFGGESAAGLVKRYDNLLIVRTFSKSRSLAGGRLGYAIGCRELIGGLETMRFSFNPYNVNRLTLLAGKAAAEDYGYFISCRDKIVRTREETSCRLRDLGFEITDSRANFIFAGGHKRVTGREYFEHLRGKNIFVRHFNVPRIENYVRITVGTPEHMDALLRETELLLEAGN